MYLVKISCVILAFLGTVNIWRISGAPQPASLSQSTSGLGVAQKPIPLGYQGPSLLSRSPITAVPFEQYFRQNEDGTYEYRHALPNGGMHTEQSYKVPYGDKEIFAARGFYSYQQPNGKFLTVYYIADQNGFRQTSSTITLRLPEKLLLPFSEGSGSNGDSLE